MSTTYSTTLLTVTTNSARPATGRGNAFWILLRINPAQESLWFDLLDGEVANCEFRLQEHRTNWVLHVIVEYDVPESAMPDNSTYIGFDIGKSKLLTGCVLTDNGTTTQPYFYDGGRARQFRTFEQPSRCARDTLRFEE